MSRCLTPLLLLAAVAGCDPGPRRPEARPDAAVRIPRIGLLRFEVDSTCVTPVVFPGENAPVRVYTPALDGDVRAKVVDGPAVLVEREGTEAVRPVIAGHARFNLTCTGYGWATVFAVDAEGRAGTSDPVLCVRPSGYDRACRSDHPRPLGDWRIEQFAPTGDLNRRLTPAGLALGELTDRTALKLRLVFEGGERPAVAGEIAVEVVGGPAGVTVSPEAKETEPGTGEAEFELASGDESGTFELRYLARLDGEERELLSQPFEVTAPPAGEVEVECGVGDRPVRVFDAAGGIDTNGQAIECVLRARSEAGPPVDGTRFWVLSEAGQAIPSRGRLPASGEVAFTIEPRDRPPVDAAPPGPSPLDGVVTVVGVVEGAEALGQDVGEPFVDADDDGERGPTERYLDTDGDGAWTGPDGERSDYALHSSETRLRWVGPVVDRPDALRFECVAPDCSPVPVPGVHDGCAADAAAYLLPGAVVAGEATPADRNGQCTETSGFATLFVTPGDAARLEDPDGGEAPEVALGPCGLAGLAPTQFVLRLKYGSGPFTVGLGLPDGGLVERTVCAP